MFCSRPNISTPPPITASSDVVLSMLIVSLPNVGMMTRIACGSTMRRIVSVGDMPSEDAASIWPASTEMMPARTSSAAYAASLRPRARMATTKRLFTSVPLEVEPMTRPVNGRPA